MLSLGTGSGVSPTQRTVWEWARADSPRKNGNLIFRLGKVLAGKNNRCLPQMPTKSQMHKNEPSIATHWFLECARSGSHQHKEVLLKGQPFRPHSTGESFLINDSGSCWLCWGPERNWPFPDLATGTLFQREFLPLCQFECPNYIFHSHKLWSYSHPHCLAPAIPP